MNNLKVEKYLNKLEKELRVIPALKKSEIILETKEHIESHLEKGDVVEDILKELGRADQLGQKYLRSLGYLRKEKSSFGKYFFMSVLTLILLLFVGAGTILWKFSPIISVDEQTGRFQFLGGLIDIQAGSNGSFFMQTPDSIEFSSEVAMTNPNIEKIDIRLENGFFTFKAHSSQSLVYRCKADEDYSQLVKLESESIRMQWDDKSLSCEMFIPKSKKVLISMDNGSVLLDEIEAGVDLTMNSGVVTINPGLFKYNYHLSVVNGVIDEFKNSNEANAYKIKIDIQSGKISKQ